MLSQNIGEFWVLIPAENQEDGEFPRSFQNPYEMFWYIFDFLSLAKSKMT